MYIYTGTTVEGVRTVRYGLAGQPFRRLAPGPSLKLRKHSPDGFAWGYGGSGPAQLALALLLHATGSAVYATEHYQHFKRTCVATLPDDWRITQVDILIWLSQVTAAHPDDPPAVVQFPVVFPPEYTPS